MHLKNFPRILYLATKNANKIEEIHMMLGGQCPDIREASQLKANVSWKEVGDTFEDNAKIKAMAVSPLTNECILAEDSGLCVEALDGQPGVHSKRYADETGDSSANIAKLLAAMKDIPEGQRKATFVCAMVYIDQEGKMRTFEGRCDGIIATEERGEGGFGYDSVFIPQGFSQTLAELTPEEKNAISHRRKALEMWAESL